MRSRPIYDVVALLARCGVGLVFVAHGWQKIQVGITATGRNLDAMGAPAPTAAAVFSTFAELLGGVALILGLALPAAGILLFLDMAGAMVFVHAKHGIFLVHDAKVTNGFELVLILGLAALLFATGGGGRLTLDRRLFGRSGTERGAARDDDADQGWFESIRPDEREEGAGPASDEDSQAPRGRSKSRRPRKRTVEPPPAERSGEHPIPPAGAFEAGTDEKSPARPRLAAEMAGDTSRDVIVAGKKPDSPSGKSTATARTRKKPSKSD
jgi:putative oxidoreductase